MMHETGQTIWEADLYRTDGELRLARGGAGAAAAAEAAFERAIATARAQSARFWELRATICLARLWFGQGKREQASAALAAVCATFIDGHDIPDLAQARMLVETWQPSISGPSSVARR